MATNTSILGLSKPAYTDDADVAVINSNSDLIDAEAGRTRANFAAEYSTSSAYAVGAFCTHAGILYQCNTAIGSGGEAWTAAHWTQISAAAAITANNQAIATLNGNLTATNNRTLAKRYYAAYTVNSTNVSWSWGTGYLQLVGDLLILSTGISPSTASNDWLNLLTMQSDYKPTHEVRCVATAEDGSETRLVRITTDGKIDILKPNTKAYWFEIIWFRNISN